MSRRSRVIGWWVALPVTLVALALGEIGVVVVSGSLLFVWTLSFDIDRQYGIGSRWPWGWPPPSGMIHDGE